MNRSDYSALVSNLRGQPPPRTPRTHTAANGTTYWYVQGVCTATRRSPDWIVIQPDPVYTLEKITVKGVSAHLGLDNAEAPVRAGDHVYFLVDAQRGIYSVVRAI